jgi:hypothetical protein
VRLLVATVSIAALPALTAVTPAHATEECIAWSTSHTGESGEDGDCVHIKVYTAVDGRLVVKYWGNQDYDFYQHRWWRPGRAETQFAEGEGASGGWWVLENAWSDTTYTFSVQACYDDWPFGSDCTGWVGVEYVLHEPTVGL